VLFRPKPVEPQEDHLARFWDSGRRKPANRAAPISSHALRPTWSFQTC
jgi:hypothetical protein